MSAQKVTFPQPKDRFIVALDFPELSSALNLAEAVAPYIGWLKVGLELFNSAGPSAIAAMKNFQKRIFYDSKFADIPNTIAGAASAAVRMRVDMFNLHAFGGSKMMQAARKAADRTAQERGSPPPLIIAVTLLTSLDEITLREELGISGTTESVALRLALLAREAGLDGVVASVHEVAKIKQICGKDFLTITPGIRPKSSAADDQSRIATPTEALAAGADLLVVGRPITQATDPAAAARELLKEITEAARSG